MGGKSCIRFLTDGAASLYEKTSRNKMFRRGNNILTSFGVSAERVTLARKSLFSRLWTPVQFVKERWVLYAHRGEGVLRRAKVERIQPIWKSLVLWPWLAPIIKPSKYLKVLPSSFNTLNKCTLSIRFDFMEELFGRRKIWPC